MEDLEFSTLPPLGDKGETEAIPPESPPWRETAPWVPSEIASDLDHATTHSLENRL
jgi:hypothetical protein